MLMMSVIALLVGLLRRSDFSRKKAFLHPIFLGHISFVIVQVASVYYGGAGAMADEFLYWYVFPMFVVISVLLAANPLALKRYVWGMIVGSMVVVGYGIYAVPAWGGYQGTGRAGAYGMYDNHNDYSFIIIQIIPFIYLYMRSERGILRRSVLAISLLACVVGILMSLSRGGMIAMVLEFFLIILIGMQGRRRLLLIPVLALIGAGAIAYQYDKRAENQGSGYTAEDAESGRVELWKAGAVMLAHNPLLGVGSRRFPEYAWQYADLGHDLRGKVSHNTYVEVFSTSGLLGFFAFIYMSYHLIKELRRRGEHLGPPWLDVTRRATLISFYAILLRAFLDAKPHDWSFYVLCAIGVACGALQRQIDAAAGEKGKSVKTAASIAAPQF